MDVSIGLTGAGEVRLLETECRKSRGIFHHAHSTGCERGRITRRSKETERGRVLKYRLVGGDLPVRSGFGCFTRRRQSMKTLTYLALGLRLFITAVSPASGAPALVTEDQ